MRYARTMPCLSQIFATSVRGPMQRFAASKPPSVKASTLFFAGDTGQTGCRDRLRYRWRSLALDRRRLGDLQRHPITRVRFLATGEPSPPGLGFGWNKKRTGPENWNDGKRGLGGIYRGTCNADSSSDADSCQEGYAEQDRPRNKVVDHEMFSMQNHAANGLVTSESE